MRADHTFVTPKQAAAIKLKAKVVSSRNEPSSSCDVTEAVSETVAYFWRCAAAYCMVAACRLLCYTILPLF